MKHLLLLDANAGMANISGTVKPSGRVVLHCAEQYPHTASITTTANIILVSAGTEQFKHYIHSPLCCTGIMIMIILLLNQPQNAYFDEI